MAYIYRIEVKPWTSGWWSIVVHSSDGAISTIDVYQWKWRAVRAARALASRTADWQGTNLRLELKIHGKLRVKTHEYGRDPRSVR